MAVALYDVELAHNIKGWCPNLELMKVFDYYYKRNEVVHVIIDTKNISHYRKIIVFKNSPTLKFPSEILANEKAEIYGYGFYWRFIPLDEKYQSSSPNFLAYFFFSERILNIKKYEKIMDNSIVRVENMDLTGFKPDRKMIYVADHNFIQLPNAKEFLINYKQYKIDFLEPLVVKNEQELFTFFPLIKQSTRRIIIDFEWDDILFDLYKREKVLFNLPQRFLNGKFIYLCELIKLILKEKNDNSTILFNYLQLEPTQKKMPYFQILQEVLKWGSNKNQKSFLEFCPEIERQHFKIFLNNDELRILSKTRPQNLTK